MRGSFDFRLLPFLRPSVEMKRIMSLQRVIEIGRKQGIPVIVTDIAGREPMVLLPLDTYERLLDAPSESAALMVDVAPAPRPAEQKAPAQALPSSKQNPQPSQKTAYTPPPPSTKNQAQPQPTTPSPGQDGLRVRQRDEDRVQALHRSLDEVAEAASPSPTVSRSTAEGLLPEETFLFQE